jgi:hypothetical protein
METNDFWNNDYEMIPSPARAEEDDDDPKRAAMSLGDAASLPSTSK